MNALAQAIVDEFRTGYACDLCRDRAGTRWLDGYWTCAACSDHYLRRLSQEQNTMPRDAVKTRRTIGASEIAAIYNVHPQLTALSLALHKRGLLEPSPPNWRMRFGKICERPVLEVLYVEMTGHPIKYFDETVVHPKRPRLVCTPDALRTDEQGGVEGKISFDRSQWGSTVDEVPEHYQLQVYFSMAVTGLPKWDLFAVVMGEPINYSFESDPELQQALEERGDWWAKTFIEGDALPPIDGSPEATRWLQQLFPAHKRPDIQRATAEQVRWLEEYAAVRADQHALQARRDLLENQFRQAIGEHEGLCWERGRFTWRKTRDVCSVDWESMAHGLINKYVTDPHERTTILDLYTRTKPGQRRIHFTHDKDPDTQPQTYTGAKE